MLENYDLNNVLLPSEFRLLLNNTSDSYSFDHKVKIRLAISLLLEKEITFDKAAQLAGLSSADFKNLLNVKNISITA